MAIKMTSAEYEMKYGAPPVLPSASTAPTPAKMTQAQYDAKYKTPAPAPSQNTPPEYAQGGTGLTGFFTGAAKGIGSTVAGAENLMRKAMDVPVKAILGSAGVDYKPTATLQETPQVQSALQTHGLTEKFGFGAEQLGEYFVPGSVEEEAGLKAEQLLSKAPQAIKTIGKYGAKALATAGSMAGLNALQEGSLKDFKSQATLGGVLSLLSAPVEKLVSKIPETAWSAILKRTPAAVVKNPGLEESAAKTGLAGISNQSIMDKAGAQLSNIELGIDGLIKNAKGKLKTSVVTDYVKELRDAYTHIPGEEASVKAIDDTLKSLKKKYGEFIDIKPAQQLKKDIYQHIAKSYGKGLMEISPVTETQKQIARGLKTELEKVVPGIGDLNKQHAIYTGIQEALDRAMAKGTGKGIAGTGVGLTDLLTAGVGGVTFGPIGLGAAVIKKGAESTAVLSGVSKALNYFNTLSPTAKMMFMSGLKGLISEAARSGDTIESVKKAASNVGQKISSQAVSSPLGKMMNPQAPATTPPITPAQ